MSVYAFTAPTISEEEVRAELEALTDEERLLLTDEIYGREEAIDEPESMADAIDLFGDALEAIPNEDKPAYIEALERAPELVERETPAIAFLRCEKYDAWAAARRLVAYWKARKYIFGSSRAFLPMTLDGAMQDDVESLRKSLVRILPDDSAGRSVMYYDRIRSATEASFDSVSRCFFYMFHIMAEREASQKNGCVVLVNLRGYDLYKHFNRISSKKVVMTVTSIPSRVKAGHICTGSGKSVVTLLFPVLLQMAGKYLRQRAYIHAGFKSEILAELEDFGLGTRHVEPMFGDVAKSMDGFGDVAKSMDGFGEWLEDRRVLELLRTGEGEKEEQSLVV